MLLCGFCYLLCGFLLQRHGADEISSGERHNLIMWSKNETYRESALFEQAMRTYLPESGPPDPLCLSYTHDRDFLAFREYPEGTNPYRNLFESSEEEAGKAMLPWCPPARLGYEGMLSHNKLMLLHYERECDREDRAEGQTEKKKHRHTADVPVPSTGTGDSDSSSPCGQDEEKTDLRPN